MSSDRLLEDLDLLASLSSVEAYYGAELPELHAIALDISGHANDRTGRYAAVRDCLGQAIGRIDDESFAGAAHALLGYSDRWRSVRDRSTDAGRAFTPSVSYDAFRRKSGKNYRGNTLRMVADALQTLQVEAHQNEATSDTQSASAPDAPGESNVDTEVAGRARGDGSSPRAGWRRRGLVALAVAALAIGAGAIAVLSISTTPDASAGEIDFSRHCKSTHADLGDLFGERVPEAEFGWVCRDASGSTVRAPDLAALCHEQYGPSARAERDIVNESGWQCLIEIEDLTEPVEFKEPSSCDIAVGAFDSSATRQFERYASRFVTAYEQADLPESTCPAEAMHFYGDPDLGGVVQRLEDEGRVIGAILAEDPINVVLMAGTEWMAYEAIRGLPVYRLGLGDVFEHRAGYPLSKPMDKGGYWQTDLSGGGALIASDLDASYAWAPSVILNVWNAIGGAESCLGLPLRSPNSAPDAEREQQFEHAAIGLNEDGGFYFRPAGVC